MLVYNILENQESKILLTGCAYAKGKKKKKKKGCKKSVNMSKRTSIQNYSIKIDFRI